MTVLERALAEAELDWWKGYLDHPTAKQRMWALYGSRYYSFFAEEMWDAGSTLEIGSGPLPVMEVMHCDSMLAVDPLGAEYSKLTNWPITSVDIAEIGPDSRWRTVLLLNVLDHADNPEHLMEHAYRLVRPGGKVLVFVHLNHSDDRHNPIQEFDVTDWIAKVGLTIERDAIIEKPYDPPAYAAVCSKPSIEPEEGFALAADALNAAGATWWLACGSALGAHRGGTFIEWDHDIDIGVMEGADVRAIQSELEARGFEVWRRLGTPSDGYVMQMQHPRMYLLLDIYMHYRSGDQMWMAVYPTKGRGRYVYESRLFDELEQIELGGVSALVPGVEYLEAHYGDWQTPRKDWDWAQDPLCLRR